MRRTMGPSRIALALCLVLLVAGRAQASDAAHKRVPMFMEPLLNKAAGHIKHAAAGGRARPMSVNEEYSYYPPETKSVNFRTTSAYNCAAFGCFDPTGTAVCGNTDVFAETSLSCSNQESYSRRGSGHYDNFGSGFMGDAAQVNVGTCTWEIRRITSRTVTLPDGETQRRGTVRGTCTISPGAEQCNEHKDGPLCGGMILNIDAGWYRTPNAWWQDTRTFPLANDGLQCFTDAAGVTTCYPSCCWLDAVGVIQDNALCAGFPVENNNLDRRALLNSTHGSARALLESNQGDLGTANYGYDEWSGTYYTGTATVLWGTWHATNMATGEKWEDEGTMQWVVEVIADAVGNPHTGTPPSDRYELEPNSVRFEFTKKKSYSYSQADADSQK